MQLPPSIQPLWSAYESAEKDRVRGELMVTLEALLIGIEAESETLRDGFAFWIAARSLDRGESPKIRLPLFRRLLFPALRRGIEGGDGACARWLAKLEAQRVHSSDLTVALPIELRTTHGLLVFALDRDPRDEEARRMLLQLLEGWIEYSLHELPTGVLGQGAGIATVGDCDENMSDLEEFERHASLAGRSAEFAELVREARLHYAQYRRYLIEDGASSGSYEEFLRRQH